VLVCRANYNGMWVTGELHPEDKSCIVSFVGIKRSYEQYQVLQNVNDGGRLGWSSWDKYKVVPTGAVACGDGVETFVARRRGGSNEESNAADGSNIDGTPGFTYHVGKLDPKDGFGKISIVNEVMFIPVCAPFWPDRLLAPSGLYSFVWNITGTPSLTRHDLT
jgi:Protein of unknown function (DUF3421).